MDKDIIDIKNKIDKILNSKLFREDAEKKLGFIKKVKVDYSSRKVTLIPFSNISSLQFDFHDFIKFYNLYKCFIEE